MVSDVLYRSASLTLTLCTSPPSRSASDPLPGPVCIAPKPTSSRSQTARLRRLERTSTNVAAQRLAEATETADRIETLLECKRRYGGNAERVQRLQSELDNRRHQISTLNLGGPFPLAWLTSVPQATPGKKPRDTPSDNLGVQSVLGLTHVCVTA